MEQLRQHIRDYLAHLAAHPPSNGEIIAYTVADEERGHYLVLDVGWSGGRRFHAVVLHVRLVDGIVVIEHDGTPDGGIERWLTERGIAAEAITVAVMDGLR